MTCEGLPPSRPCGVDIDQPSPTCSADHPDPEPVGWLVMSGTPTDGFNFTGWWGSHDEALAYCETTFAGTDWWIVPMYAPVEQD